MKAKKQRYKDKKNALKEEVAELEEEIDTTKRKKNRKIMNLKAIKEEHENKIEALEKKKKKLKKKLQASEEARESLEDFFDRDDSYYKKQEDLIDDVILICKENPNKANSYFSWIVKVVSETKLSATLSKEQLGLLGNDIAEIYSDSNTIDLSISLSKKTHLHYLKMLSYFELPSINEFSLFNVPEDAEEVKELICNIKSKDVDDFKFNSGFNLIDISEYTTLFGTIRQNLNTTHFSIDNWRIGSRQFVELMSQLKHSQYIWFYDWELETDEEFSFEKTLDGATIRKIDFSLSFSTYNSDAKAHPERIANILKALGEVQDVRNNLKEIGISDIEKEVEDGITKMFKQSNLANWTLYIY